MASSVSDQKPWLKTTEQPRARSSAVKVRPSSGAAPSMLKKDSVCSRPLIRAFTERSQEVIENKRTVKFGEATRLRRLGRHDVGIGCVFQRARAERSQEVIENKGKEKLSKAIRGGIWRRAHPSVPVAGKAAAEAERQARRPVLLGIGDWRMVHPRTGYNGGQGGGWTSALD